ncbi:MAG: cytochrome-c peroxidase [Chitinophagaceae bacterium]|nr:MAG: cytochrome-c peroxidase [Chitinophagaceae bacterium]
MRATFFSISLIALVLLYSGLPPASPTPLRISYPAGFGNRISIPADNPTTVEGVALGRMLFYETALSVNDKFSCGSCHQQSRAFTDGKQFSEGVDGVTQPRNTMALVNLLWVRQFFWDGRTRGLEDQVTIPMTGVHEMGQSLERSSGKLRKLKTYAVLFEKAFGSPLINEKRIRQALAQFQRTLVSADSRYDRYLAGTYRPTASELNGTRLFYTNPDPSKGIRGAGCRGCHGGDKTYTEMYHNNGLDTAFADQGRQGITGQPQDAGRFRVVSLRNIALTAPYMHDGRFDSLSQVIDHYNREMIQTPTLSPALRSSNLPGGSSLGLTDREKKDLLAFLHMLTDSTFITNQQFADPFNK